MREDLIWRKGPPPHVGWWNASTKRDEHIWRWWNGRYWSMPANEDFSAKWAGRASRKKAVFCLDVEYRTFYPKNARVPRIVDARKEGKLL